MSMMMREDFDDENNGDISRYIFLNCVCGCACAEAIEQP